MESLIAIDPQPQRYAPPGRQSIGVSWSGCWKLVILARSSAALASPVGRAGNNASRAGSNEAHRLSMPSTWDGVTASGVSRLPIATLNALGRLI